MTIGVGFMAWRSWHICMGTVFVGFGMAWLRMCMFRSCGSTSVADCWTLWWCRRMLLLALAEVRLCWAIFSMRSIVEVIAWLLTRVGGFMSCLTNDGGTVNVCWMR